MNSYLIYLIMEAVKQSKKLYFDFVLAACKNNGIGYKGGLPWKISLDMKFFKMITSSYLRQNDLDLNKAYFNLQNFKEYSLEPLSGDNKRNMVIMGRKTWDSIPKNFRPLNNRINVILTTKKDFQSSPSESVFVINNINEIEPLYYDLVNKVNEVYIIGGSEIYELFLKEYPEQCRYIYFTYINNDFQCDCYFTHFHNFNQIFSSSFFFERENVFSFNILKNKLLLNEFTENDRILKNIFKDLYNESEEFKYFQKLGLFRDHFFKETKCSNIMKEMISQSFCFDLKDYAIPLFAFLNKTEYNVQFWKVLEILLFNLQGNRSLKYLHHKNIHDLDRYGIDNDDLGPYFGFNWREYGRSEDNKDEEKGIDQVFEVLNKIKNNPEDRRLIINSWNPENTHQIKINKCPIILQFYVDQSVLYLQVYQNSGNLLTLSSNITGLSILLIIFSNLLKLTPGKLFFHSSNPHLIEDDIITVSELKYINDSPKKLLIKRELCNIKDFLDLTKEDFDISP